MARSEEKFRDVDFKYSCIAICAFECTRCCRWGIEQNIIITIKTAIKFRRETFIYKVVRLCLTRWMMLICVFKSFEWNFISAWNVSERRIRPHKNESDKIILKWHKHYAGLSASNERKQNTGYWLKSLVSGYQWKLSK